MPISHVPIFSGDNFSLVDERLMLRGKIVSLWLVCIYMSVEPYSWSEGADFSTHHSDHDEDSQVETLPMVHVHGLRLNKDQQLGPVPQKTPWPTIPRQLEGKELDDWLKARFLVSKDGDATVVILQPAVHRELTQESLLALKQWTFLPQMDGDQPVEGEVSIRIHFRTQ
jgi:hypothetical protein